MRCTHVLAALALLATTVLAADDKPRTFPFSKADLEAAGFTVVGKQSEFTVYDGRAELDAGWLDGTDGKETP